MCNTNEIVSDVVRLLDRAVKYPAYDSPLPDGQIVLFLRGLPGSGKSTYARQLVTLQPDRWIRLNKDDLRGMMHDHKWSKGREALVVQTERQLAEQALADGLSVIVDDTNFALKHEAYFQELADDKNVPFIVKFFDVPVEECIKRDLARRRSVGKDVILRMHAQHLCPAAPPDVEGLPFAVIVDMDGTLALMDGRGPFEFDKVGTDKVNYPVKAAVGALALCGCKLLIVSGRDGGCETATREWLFRNGNAHDYELFMRPAGNREKDAVIKRRIYDEHIAGKYNVVAVFDDRPCVIRMWRSLGLFVFDCGNGYEF